MRHCLQGRNVSRDFQLAWPHDLPKMRIYVIVCSVTGQVYVGQSRRIRNRWKDHVTELNSGRGSPRLQEREQYYTDTSAACSNCGLNTLPTAGSFKGYTPDEIARAKIGAATKKWLAQDPTLQIRMVRASLEAGYCPTEKHRNRIGAAHKRLWADGVQTGHPRSDECRRKISDACKGRPSPMKGRAMNDEAKRKIGEANKRRAAERREGKVLE